MATPKFQALRGTRDILTPDSERHRALVDAFAEQARLAGYGHIMSPIFEDLGVFLRVGDSTDVANSYARVAIPDCRSAICLGRGVGDAEHRPS